jgi:hypothetical protein
MTKNRFPITFQELKDMFTRLHKTEWFALVYDLTEDFQGRKFNGRVFEYVDERNIYEQVEFFDNIDTLHERIEELKRITNKNYSNFRIHIRETYVK